MERDRREKAEELFPHTGKPAGPDRIIDHEIPASGQDTETLFHSATDSVPQGNELNSTELPDTLSQAPPVTESNKASETEIQNDTVHTHEIQNALIAVPDSTGTISDAPGSINISSTINHGTPGTSDSIQKSVWERIEIREKQIESGEKQIQTIEKQIDNSRITLSAVPVRSIPVEDVKTLPEKTFNYDASEFLESGWGYGSHQILIPSGIEESNELSGAQTVFNQPNPSSINKANGAYIAYIQNDNDSIASPDIQQSSAWVPALVILSLLLLAWIKLIYVQFLTPVLVSAFSYKESVKLYHGKNAPAQNAFLILNIIFAINGGLFLLFVSGFFNFNLPDITPVLLFFGASACLVLLFMLKSFTLRIIGFLFDKHRLFSEYNYNISLYNKIYGLLLLPLVVGMLYGSAIIHDKIIYAGLALGGVFYLLQLFRGLEIIVRKDFSVFYLILYLCAFEIFPILVIYKLIQTFLM